MNRQVGTYGIVVATVASIASVILSLIVSFAVSNRSIQAEQRAREGTRIATCLVVEAQVAVYQEAPPSTPTGRKAERAWTDLYARLHCERT